MISGKADIQKDIEASLAKRTKGYTTAYDVVDVYGNANVVTEVGTITSFNCTNLVFYVNNKPNAGDRMTYTYTKQ